MENHKIPWFQSTNQQLHEWVVKKTSEMGFNMFQSAPVG
jgi:hypothetical protein